MNRIARVTVLALLLADAISCTLARPATAEGYPARESNDDRSAVIHSEARDMLSDGSTPKRRVDDKKRMKNASGKSDEGGFYKTYGSDAEGEKGYLKQTYSNGDHGYKTLDTFHKKDGDNYGFEKHTAFGKARGGGKGGRQGKSGSYSTKANPSGDHEGAGTIVDTHYVEDDGENAGYTEAEGDGGDEDGESASYTDGGDSESYTSGGDSGHYTEGGSSSGNDGNSDGYNEHYSSGGGDEGLYASRGSYNTGGDGGGFYGGEYY